MKTILIFQPRRLRWVRYPRCPPACSLHSSPSSVLALTWWNSSLDAPPWQGWLQPSLTSPAVPPISSEPPTPRRVVSRPRGDRGDQHTLQSSPTTGPCTAATTPNRPRPWSLTIPQPGKHSDTRFVSVKNSGKESSVSKLQVRSFSEPVGGFS